MIQKTIYNHQCGLGVVTDSFNLIYQIATPKKVSVNAQEITPGELTHLSNFFAHEIKYIGKLTDHEDCLVFYLGSNKTLFEEIHYFKCIHKISETRLFDKYTEISGRDFNYINGQWK